MFENKYSKNTSALALGAIISAISIGLLYAAGMLPTMRIALSALAGVFSAVILIKYGVMHAILVFASTSIISLIIVPAKIPGLMYTAFFGYYPILKYFYEKLQNILLEIALKLLTFNIIFTIMISISTRLVGIEHLFTLIAPLFLYLAANFAFLFYDIAFTFLITQFKSRFNRL
ncbi:MAG: hypothetical protein N2Z65_04990 [Clostridiales bacterium]|nr:hypothetical protein [Clostridiales bacterium]